MQSETIRLGYAKPTRLGHSAWAVAGFGLAVLSTAVPASMGWMILQDVVAVKGSHIRVGIGPFYYLFPVAAIVLCAIGWPKRSKLFPVLGFVVASIAIAGAALLTFRTW